MTLRIPTETPANPLAPAPSAAPEPLAERRREVLHRTPLVRFLRDVHHVASRALAGVTEAFRTTPLGRRLHARLEQRREHRIELELPSDAARITWPRIAFLSDVHAGYYMGAAELAAMAERVNAHEPDLICLGGDLVNHHAHELDLLEPVLRSLRAPLGVYAVPGNHDYVAMGDIDEWMRRVEGQGVRVLMNEGVRIHHGGSSFWLCGVDDLTEGVPRLDEALAGQAPDEPAVLLSHHPDLFAEAEARGVDLQLSGHTHGGQIRIGRWVPLHHSRYRFVAGLYVAGASHLYVGRGAGVTALPIRYGTRSEIAIVHPRGRG